MTCKYKCTFVKCTKCKSTIQSKQKKGHKKIIKEKAEENIPELKDRSHCLKAKCPQNWMKKNPAKKTKVEDKIACLERKKKAT